MEKTSSCRGLGVQVLLLLCCAAACAPLASGHVPVDLTNFQGEYACDPASTAIVRPATLDDVAEAVRLHAHIRANGEGHSWNQPANAWRGATAATSGAQASGSSGSSSAQVADERQLASRGLRQADAAPSGNASATTRPASANVVMSTLRPLVISVDEAGASVWADAGVKTIDLLTFLSSYVTPDAPAGYTLGAFPWFVYQTVGGAVATGTHGSNLGPHKSMSNQVLALEVVLANGTRRVFTNSSDPFLMRALRVSVGRLGIITRVKFAIVKEVPVHRSLKALSAPGFLAAMEEAQGAWTATGTAPAWTNESQIFWLPQQQQFMLVGFARADAPDAADAKQALAGYRPDTTTVFTKKGDLLALGELVMPADAVISVNESQVLLGPPPAGAAARDLAPYKAAQRWVDGYLTDLINRPLTANDTGGPAAAGGAAARAAGASWTLPAPKKPSAFYGSEANAETLLNISRLGITTIANNLTAEATQIYIKQPAQTLVQLQNTLYDQYEVSIPLAAMASCWRRVLEVLYEGDLAGTNATQRARDKGFRTAALIRFVGAEDGLLSHTHDGPRMYVNLEDYKSRNTQPNAPNRPFRAVMAALTGDPACTLRGAPRLHWGKAGWPDSGCWHGDRMFGDNWCHFGCAVMELDPTGKFQGAAADRWTWTGVDLARCCGPAGFRAGEPGCSCSVRHARAMRDCPPAPYYTTR